MVVVIIIIVVVVIIVIFDIRLRIFVLGVVGKFIWVISRYLVKEYILCVDCVIYGSNFYGVFWCCFIGCEGGGREVLGSTGGG